MSEQITHHEYDVPERKNWKSGFVHRETERTDPVFEWINGIKKELSTSTAILSRRKTGKTALLQRLYNLTFEANDGMIPFYYEMKEGRVWALEFCKDFFLSFLYQ